MSASTSIISQQWAAQADDVSSDPSSQHLAIATEQGYASASLPPPGNGAGAAPNGAGDSASLSRARSAEALAISLEALRGTQANYVQALVSMVASVVASLAGLAAVDAGDGAALGGAAKAVFGFATLLFISSGLGLSKAVRDRSFADAFALAAGAGPAGALRTQLRGSTASLFAAAFGAGAALCMAGASVLLLNGRGTSANHLFVCLAFCLSSTVTVAKVVRDRFDADFLEACGLSAGTGQLAHLVRASDSLVGGTKSFFILSLGAALSSVTSVLAVIITSSLGAEAKTIVAVCVILLAIACINASKMVRDKIDRTRGAAQNTISWNLITSLSFVLAVVAAASVAYWICAQGVLSASLCGFVSTGMLWVVASVLTFSKVARDREERGRALASGSP